MTDAEFEARMPLTRDSGNHVGIMHAGALFAVGELMGGLVVARYLEDPQKFQPVVRQVRIDFRAPALTAVTARASFSSGQGASMNRALSDTGRFDFELTTRIFDEGGAVVAQTAASYAIRNFTGA